MKNEKFLSFTGLIKIQFESCLQLGLPKMSLTIDFLLVDWKRAVLYFFSSTARLFQNMTICVISVTFFFTGAPFYEYVQSNHSNTWNREKPLQKEQSFFLQCSSLFLRASVSCLLIKNLWLDEVQI